MISALCPYVSIAAQEEKPQGQLLDKMVASVDDQPIFQSEIEAIYQAYQAQQGMDNKPSRCQILENMIINKMMLSNAVKRGIEVKKEEVEFYVNDRIQSILKEVGTEAALEAYMNRSMGSLKNELRKNLREQLTIEKMSAAIGEGLKVSPAEVKAFFNQLPADELPLFLATVEAYHIVQFVEVTEQEKNKLLEKMMALRERIQGGEDFAACAKTHSEDTASAIQGGEIGFWHVGDLDMAYEKAALSLQPGELSMPIATQFGVHLIQLLEKQQDRYNTRHILLKFPVASEVSEKCVKQLNDIRSAIIDQKITFENAAKRYSEDLATAQKGGLLTDSKEGVQMAVEKLSSDLFFILDKMVPGDISEPLLGAIDGKQAARIVYLKRKTPTHYANLEQDYERLHELALNDKKQKKLGEWLEQAKVKAIIQIDPMYQKGRIEKLCCLPSAIFISVFGNGSLYNISITLQSCVSYMRKELVGNQNQMVGRQDGNSSLSNKRTYYAQDPPNAYIDQGWPVPFRCPFYTELISTRERYKKDAAKGDIEAQWALLAEKGCLKAANGGHAAAQWNWELQYLEGLGCKKDLAKAVEWLTKAAAQRHQDAKDALQKMSACK
eukprot:gene742-920_t